MDFSYYMNNYLFFLAAAHASNVRNSPLEIPRRYALGAGSATLDQIIQQASRIPADPRLVLVYTPGLINTLERAPMETPAQTANILKPMLLQLFQRIKDDNPNSNIILITTKLAHLRQKYLTKPKSDRQRRRDAHRQRHYREMNEVLEKTDFICSHSGIATISVPRNYLGDDGLHLTKRAYTHFIPNAIYDLVN